VANPDGITDDVRKREEEYFRQRDKELIERMRAAAEAERTRKNLQSASGIQDESLLRDLEQLGFTPETLPLLPLVPVLQVAWAEGGISAAERTMIVNLARARGMTTGSPADLQLADWLDRRPSDGTFQKAGRLIAAMLDHPGTLNVDPGDLLAYCEQIAAASGGILGIGKVSPEERAALQQIATQLKNR
jgi:tellurite resistance protein